MSDQPVQLDENTPPEPFVNEVSGEDESAEISKDQEPVADLDENVEF